MNIDKDYNRFFNGEPPGEKTNSIRWLQKLVMKKAIELPQEFTDLNAWEEFRQKIRQTLPDVIGIPSFPEMKESMVRARIKVGADIICERIDIYVDEDYSIPSFVFSPLGGFEAPRPALVWNPGWSQDKYEKSYQEFGVRMARQGFVVLIPDHAPFGETSYGRDKASIGMSLAMGMGNILGISHLALRAAETMRAGEYLRNRSDVDERRVAIAGLCQGGMDTWLSAALDDGFCAAAPFMSESTFAIHMAEMSSYTANADSSPFPFGILKVCDIEHLHACIAPRPLLVRANLTDNWWPVSGYDSVEAFTRKVYRLYGAEGKVDFRAEVHVHDLTGPFADALEKFLLEYV